LHAQKNLCGKIHASMQTEDLAVKNLPCKILAWKREMVMQWIRS
jgi:hypothetical protein